MDSTQSSQIIKDYLAKHKIPIREFAKHCHVHYTTIHRWISGASKVSKKNARWLQSRTKGGIKAVDLWQM